MIERIGKLIACKFSKRPKGSRGYGMLNVPPLGSGGYERFSVQLLGSGGLRARWLAALVMILGFIQGCATVPANIAAPIPPEHVVGHASLAAGRKTYVSLFKCAMCHRPKPVSDYSAEAWAEEILPKMSKKARLSPQEYADVLAYVKATTTQK